MKLQIITIPHKVLIHPAKPVTEFGPKLKKLIADMVETLEACVDPIGVGLAAPQVGINSRVFIVKPSPKSKVKAYINPQLLNVEKLSKSKIAELSSDDSNEALEGCLSIPRIWSPVIRPQKVTMRWQDERKVFHEKTFEGFDAVIMQHELDHLDGILFTRRATEQNAPLYEEKNKKLHEMKL